MEQMQHMTLPEPGDDAGLHAYLEERIAAIHRDPQFPLPPDAYMNFYSAVWRLMYHDPNADGRNRSAHLMPGAAIAYKNLAAFLAEHLQTVVQRLQSVESSLLLEAYVAEWDRYAAATNRLNRLLELINRHYVLRHIDEGKDGIYKIRTLHFVQWRAHVWDKISGSVIDAAQRTIERGDEKAADLNNILERFASLRVDGSRSFDSDSRGSVRNKLEAAFVPEIEAHDRKIRQLKAAESGYGVGQTSVEG
ncbi:hypothetical protein FAVG1_02277 [Fusarium avenaceum]|nr:hypothetical protein FAVG1_02277 [Fusarium avenaceum]